MKRGRKPTNEPATAYDYRRYIVLVQAIATGKWTAVNALRHAWNVEIEAGKCNADGIPTFDGMVITLAQHVIEHREDTP